MGTEVKWTDETLRKFMTNIDLSGSGCWLWKAGTFSRGYGQFRIGKKKYRTHRLLWTMLKGPIPAGMIICHTCDTPRCCRLSHLFLGTHKDNSQDRDRKGRGARGPDPRKGSIGVKNGSAKVNEVTVKAIRRDRSLFKRTFSDLSKRYGISVSQARNIVNRKCWKDV